MVKIKMFDHDNLLIRPQHLTLVDNVTSSFQSEQCREDGQEQEVVAVVSGTVPAFGDGVEVELRGKQEQEEE